MSADGGSSPLLEDARKEEDPALSDSLDNSLEIKEIGPFVMDEGNLLFTDTKEPPSSLFSTFKYLGPGLIITGNVVGSGELIATTTLGAKVGFVALWMIIVSCLIKVIAQLELGRYTIIHHKTSMEALNMAPGPRFKVSWVVWLWLLTNIPFTIQYGGIFSGVGQIFQLIIPGFPVKAWAAILGPITCILLMTNKYVLVEFLSTVMVVGFTLITVAASIMMQWSEYSYSWKDIASGLTFTIPEQGMGIAFAVFGITGITANEVLSYTYWCLDKGYAKFVGDQVPDTDSDDGERHKMWVARARGWLRVMHVDAIVAMCIYTISTIAFYVLGASVLHGKESEVPEGYAMIRTLSEIYTKIFGPWALYLFLAGAFIVLYSTLFSGTASNTKVIVDCLRLMNVISVDTPKQKTKWNAVVIGVLMFLDVFWMLVLGEPVFMITLGGISQAIMMPIVAFTIIYLRYTYKNPYIRPSKLTDIFLWGCSFTMLLFALYSIFNLL